MHRDDTRRRATALTGAAAAALAAFALHALCGGRYGVFRDELYFIACGERLAAGYVDQPPVIAVVARAAHALFGTWVPGLRLVPWLASAATALLTGVVAVRLGGGAWAAALAGIAVATSPLLMALGHYLTMNAFEPALCVGLVLLLLRARETGAPGLVVAAGLLAGVATLNKYSAALFALCLLAGVLATPARRMLSASPRATAAAVTVAVLVVLPNLVWQASHGFPFLELVRNGQANKNVALSLPAFAKAVVVEPNPFAAPLWIAGLGWLLLSKAARPHRFLGVAAIVWFALLVATGAKPYYAAAIYPPLLAAGAAALDRVVDRARSLAAAAPLAVGLGGAVGLPIALPLLSPAGLVAYQEALGVELPRLERHEPSPLPQVDADQLGWQDLARAVAAAYETLTPREQALAVVYGQNYGEAAAIDVHGRALGLAVPPAISGHNNYWLWGVPPGRGDVLVVVSDANEDCAGGNYRRADVASRLPPNPWVMPYERARWIWICRDPARPLAELWPSTRHYE